MRDDHINVVLFSGGADSTLILADLLKNTDTDVIALSLNQGNLFGSGKNIIESMARDKIVEILQGRYPNRLTYLEIKLDYTAINMKQTIDERIMLAQPPMILGCLFPYLPVKSNIHIGYTEGELDNDDELGNISSLMDDMIQSMAKFTQSKPVVKYPLLFTDKVQIFKRLKKHMLLKHIVFCEQPLKCTTLTPCNSCKKVQDLIDWDCRTALVKNLRAYLENK